MSFEDPEVVFVPMPAWANCHFKWEPDFKPVSRKLVCTSCACILRHLDRYQIQKMVENPRDPLWGTISAAIMDHFAYLALASRLDG